MNLLPISAKSGRWLLILGCLCWVNTARAYIDMAPTLVKIIGDSQRIELVEVAQFDPQKHTLDLKGVRALKGGQRMTKTLALVREFRKENAKTPVVLATLLPDGVQHLSSPGNPPPGTTDDPVGPQSGPNVTYLKELWHAIQTQQVSKGDALLALTQRPLNTPVTNDPSMGTAPTDSSAPLLVPGAPAPADAAPAQ